MKLFTSTLLASIAILEIAYPAHAKDMMNDSSMSMMKPNVAMVQKMTAHWPKKIRETIVKTEDKYGMPSSVTAHEVTWANEDMSNSKLSPFKMVRIKDTETPHEFPAHHTDFMKHTIDYAVPAEKASDLEAFDGSVTYARTRGEMSAECDTPEHNILALNLANDIVTGKRSVEDARGMYAATIADEMKGNMSEYEQHLKFSPQRASGDADKKAKMADNR